MCLVGVSHDEGSSSFAAMGLSNDGKLVFNDTDPTGSPTEIQSGIMDARCCCITAQA